MAADVLHCSTGYSARVIYRVAARLFQSHVQLGSQLTLTADFALRSILSVIEIFRQL